MQLVRPTRFGPILRSQLFSPATKCRMLLDWFRRPGAPQPERSVAAFVGGHFGREAVEYLAEPLLRGIYGGSPADLSASSVLPKLVAQERVNGSLVRGLKPAATQGSIFQSLRGGLSSLTEALTPASVIRGAAERIERFSSAYRVRVMGDWVDGANVFVACESHNAARLLQPVDPDLAMQLAQIRHSSGHIAVLAFRRAELRHPLNGFGFLVPEVEGRNLMACTWMSSKFPERAPREIALLRAFFREKPSDLLSDLREIMQTDAEPLFTRTYEWPDSLPQYSVGHARRVADIEARVEALPGLYLIGNAYHGVGIPDCVRLARDTVALLR